MADILVVTSKVKAYLAKKGMRTAGDVGERLTLLLQDQLDKAAAIAEEEGVLTVKSKHIHIP